MPCKKQYIVYCPGCLGDREFDRQTDRSWGFFIYTCLDCSGKVLGPLIE